jgi:hypothetical protein
MRESTCLYDVDGDDERCVDGESILALTHNQFRFPFSACHRENLITSKQLPAEYE